VISGQCHPRHPRASGSRSGSLLALPLATKELRYLIGGLTKTPRGVTACGPMLALLGQLIDHPARQLRASQCCTAFGWEIPCSSRQSRRSKSVEASKDLRDAKPDCSLRPAPPATATGTGLRRLTVSGTNLSRGSAVGGSSVVRRPWRHIPRASLHQPDVAAGGARLPGMTTGSTTGASC
jgi:hypothetical protein